MQSPYLPVKCALHGTTVVTHTWSLICRHLRWPHAAVPLFQISHKAQGNFPLGIQSSVRLIPCALESGAVRGLDLVVLLPSKGHFDRSVTEGLEFSVA